MGVLLGQCVGIQVEQWEHRVLWLGAIPTGYLPAWSMFMGEGACVWGSLGSSEHTDRRALQPMSHESKLFTWQPLDVYGPVSFSVK